MESGPKPYIECQGLEFALRTVADKCHSATVRSGEVAGGKCRSGSGANGSSQRHFTVREAVFLGCRGRGPTKKPRRPINQAAGSRPFCLAT